MNYNLRYYMTWLSERGEDCRIEILEKDFSGTPQLKKLGSAPILHIDNADNGIIGTSLQFLMQADVDGELAGLYTVDSKKYRVLLYKNDVMIWWGYLMPELYSEEYVAPPYDINITATDQLALLKDVQYNPIGRNTILAIIDNILKPTKVAIPYNVQTSLAPTIMDRQTSFIDYASINDFAFADKTYYEALQEILSTCNMTIMQANGAWNIVRVNDVNAPIYHFGTNIYLNDIADCQEYIIGRMHEDDSFPVGNLSMANIAAKKNAKFEYIPRQAQSILIDPSMITGDGWFWNLDYINAKPGRFQIQSNGASWLDNKAADVYAFVLESTLDATKTFALWQNVSVQAVESMVSVKFSYLPLFSGRFAGQEGCEKTVKLNVHIKVVANDGTTYYLTKGGWSTDDMQNIVYTGNMVYDGGAAKRADKGQYTTGEINIPGIPVDGLLTISFRNDSRIRPTMLGGPSDTDENEGFRVYPRMAITDVFITLPEIVGYRSEVAIKTEAVQDGGEYQLAFSDAYGLPNEGLILYNYIDYEGQKMSTWKLHDVEIISFFMAMLQDIANGLSVVRKSFSGTIAGKNLLQLVYKERFSQAQMRLLAGQYNLYDDSLSGEWEEVSTQMAELSPFDTIVNNSSSTVVPGNSGNVISPDYPSNPSGGLTQADLESALAPIKDWFELKDLSNGEKVLFTKYGIASQKDQVANVVVSNGAIVTVESQPAQANIIDGEEIYSGSDMRYKWIEEKFRLNSATIAHAPLFKFKWKKDQDNRLKIGTSAQYWEEVLPELVNFDSVADFKRLNYQSLGVAIGISLAREIEWLKKQIDMQKKQIELLRTQIKGSNE